MVLDLMTSGTHHLVSTMDLKKRSEIHWPRKLWHMSGVMAIAIGYSYVPHTVALSLLAFLWLLFVPADFMRLRNPAINDFLLTLFRPIMRESERQRIAGTSFLITGVLLVALIFPKEIVILTLLFLAFADPMASYFGIKFGKDKIFGHKSLQGTLAAFFVCAILTFIFLYAHNMMMDRLIVVSLIGGLVGCLAELIPIADLDDNFTLPIMSAICLHLVFSLFGALA